MSEIQSRKRKGSDMGSVEYEMRGINDELYGILKQVPGEPNFWRAEWKPDFDPGTGTSTTFEKWERAGWNLVPLGKKTHEITTETVRYVCMETDDYYVPAMSLEEFEEWLAKVKADAIRAAATALKQHLGRVPGKDPVQALAAFARGVETGRFKG